MSKEYLNQFVLVGGTALALQIGHRKSIDLDLFTTEDFNSSELITYLLKDYQLRPTLQTPQTLICTINDIKVDFIRFKYPFKNPLILENNIRMLSLENIASMKLDAITGRGGKKDFYDLYYLLNYFTIEKLFELYLEKYQHQTIFHVIRSLSYFDDAEQQPDPIVFDKNITWNKVKTEIIKAIKKIG
jgi:predicted nucleotidyltransferase component of viral defense system